MYMFIINVYYYYYFVLMIAFHRSSTSFCRVQELRVLKYLHSSSILSYIIEATAGDSVRILLHSATFEHIMYHYCRVKEQYVALYNVIKAKI